MELFSITSFVGGILACLLTVKIYNGELKLNTIIPLFVFMFLMVFMIEKEQLLLNLRGQIEVETYNKISNQYTCFASNVSTAYFCSYCQQPPIFDAEERKQYCYDSYHLCLNKSYGGLN